MITGLSLLLPLRLRLCTSCALADRALGPLDPRWRLTLLCKRGPPLLIVDFRRILQSRKTWRDLHHDHSAGTRLSTFARRRTRGWRTNECIHSTEARKAHMICVSAPEFAKKIPPFLVSRSLSPKHVIYAGQNLRPREMNIFYFISFLRPVPWHFLNHYLSPSQEHLASWGLSCTPTPSRSSSTSFGAPGVSYELPTKYHAICLPKSLARSQPKSLLLGLTLSAS